MLRKVTLKGIKGFFKGSLKGTLKRTLKGTLKRDLKRNLKKEREITFNGASKGTFKGEFERQLSLVNLRGESGAHEAPYVALLIKGIQPALGESGGAMHIAAPLYVE